MRPYCAYFVRRPRTIADLRRLHPVEQERTCAVVKVLRLGAVDFENFITDLLADRQFIEDYAFLCAQTEPWKCLLVCPRGGGEGVLVMPERGRFVGWAALVPDPGQG